MEGRAKELYEKLIELEAKLLEGSFDSDLKLQSQKSDIQRLRDIIEELKSKERYLEDYHRNEFEDVGKAVTNTSNRLRDLSTQLDSLESRVSSLEEHKSKSDKRVWSYVDKVIIAIISGIMTLLFNGIN